MYYSDTIVDPYYSTTTDTGRHLGYGDPTTPELSFANPAEVAVAAYLMEAIGGTNNTIAKDLTIRLGIMVGAEEIDKTGLENPLVLKEDEAREVRRTVKEVAEGDSGIVFQLNSIPESVRRAAQQLHYDNNARELGSTLPTQKVPKGLDLTGASADLKAAISEIVEIEEKTRAQVINASHHSAEFATYVDVLFDSIEHPIAA